MKFLQFITLLLLLIFTGCDKPMKVEPEADYTLGKNRYITQIGGDKREYYVHVPASYDGKNPLPVVFMLHGTSGDGEKYYNISGWKEVGEKEGIITVYPSSWRYCIIEDGITANTTKWNMFPGGFEYCKGEIPRDDITFLRKIITELKDRFSINEKKIYLVGFSNGGQMAFRCGVEMSDVLAAVISNAASVARDTTAVPLRNIPIAFQLGNEDDRYFSNPAPLSGFDYALNNIQIFKDIVHSHTTTFKYNSSYAISGDTNTVMIATYPPVPANQNRSFSMILVKDLGHEYPNGLNHWMKGAERHWEWLKQYSLP